MKLSRRQHWCPDDIVVIRAGDRIPADLRVIRGAQSAGGRSYSHRRIHGSGETAANALNGELPLGDRYEPALILAPPSAPVGAKALVVATGGETELGHINQMMSDIEKHRTPLMVQMDKLGKTIFITILVMMLALFVFSLIFRDMPVSELVLSLIALR